uniref:Uncharacterized protein n=1 Tax=Knipowitschia caucasica TaxID=637954 RepID=A0AAV2MAN5_KNICA
MRSSSSSLSLPPPGPCARLQLQEKRSSRCSVRVDRPVTAPQLLSNQQPIFSGKFVIASSSALPGGDRRTDAQGTAVQSGPDRSVGFGLRSISEAGRHGGAGGSNACHGDSHANIPKLS